MSLATVPVVCNAHQTCFACPDQWEGELTDGTQFYFRYRHGVASLSTSSGHLGWEDDPNRVSVDHGDDMQGLFESDEARVRVFTRLLLEKFPHMKGVLGG